jgi:hypothetical protein
MMLFLKELVDSTVLCDMISQRELQLCCVVCCVGTLVLPIEACLLFLLLGVERRSFFLVPFHHMKWRMCYPNEYRYDMANVCYVVVDAVRKTLSHMRCRNYRHGIYIYIYIY